MSISILEEINQDVGLNDAFFERVHEQFHTRDGYTALVDIKRKFEEVGRYNVFEDVYLDFLERNYPDDWSLVYDVLRVGQNKSGNMVVCDGGTARPVKKRKKLHYMTAQELLSADLPPVEYIVDVIISKGLVILSAKSKIGKSWFALDLAIAVASGADFLGFNTTQGEVLYIDLENSKALTQQRLVRLLNGAEAPSGLTIVNDYSTMNDTFLEDITEYLEQNPKVSLVIVDVFQKIKKAKSNNKADYDDIYENFTPLKELAEKYGISLILVILYHQKDGRFDINSSEYKAIEELVLNKYFSSFLYELRTSISDKEQLEAKNSEQEQQLIELETKIKELEAKVNELEHISQETNT